MADPIIGIDVILQVMKAGEYRDFLCATEVAIDIDTETKSVKTVGDGVWARYRGQRLSYVITLNGLIKLNTGDDPAAFDLIDYQTEFLELEYRMIFEDSEGSLKVVYGNALVVKTGLSNPSDGFSTSAFTLNGCGAPVIVDALVACGITVTDITVDLTGLPFFVTFNYTHTGGTPLRFEYAIDGGGRLISASSPLTISSPGAGAHSIEIWPVCDNGYDGTSFTKSFTI